MIKVEIGEEIRRWHLVGERAEKIWQNQALFQRGSETMAQRYITNPEKIRYFNKDR